MLFQISEAQFVELSSESEQVDVRELGGSCYRVFETPEKERVVAVETVGGEYLLIRGAK